MGKDTLEQKAHKAVLSMAKHVEDIDEKLTYFLDNYRADYYSAMNGLGYKRQLKVRTALADCTDGNGAKLL